MATLVVAYLTIVALTVLLVILNAHSVVLQFLKDRNHLRLHSYLVTLAFLGSLIIVVSGNVVDRVLSSQESLTHSSPFNRY